MKLDAVFFNLIPRVNRDVARLDVQLAFTSEACQYAESPQNITSALHSKTHNTNHRNAERDVFPLLLHLTTYFPSLAHFHFTVIFL